MHRFVRLTEYMRERIEGERVDRRVLQISAGKELNHMAELPPGVVIMVPRYKADRRGLGQTRLSYTAQRRLTSAALQLPAVVRELHARTAGKQRPGLDS